MLQAVTVKNCRVCQKQFSPFQSMQVVCGIACARRVPVIEKKAARAVLAKRKEDLKSRSQWIREAQTVVNKYARLRDIQLGYGCITCGSKYRTLSGGHLFDAGHMHSRGARPELRFRLDNIALQCVKDNRDLGGLALAFREAMVKRRGLRAVETLEASQGPAKWSVDYLRRLIRVMRKKTRRLEKRLEMS